MTPLISISQLNKSYGASNVISDINLSVHPGQILGLVGPNGAGKTTCLQAMLGLVDYQGDIDILGFNPRKQREKMLEQVAYIADVAVLPKWLKVHQSLEYLAGIHPRFNRDKAIELLAKTNIKLESKVKHLSKGMITQLHLALILAIDAKVLILDEPTLGLDILTRRQFYTHLLEDFYNDDKCIIVTTHQIEEIEHILTHVAFIQAGKLVLNESTDKIKERFQLVAVTHENVAQASALKPLFSNSLMGINMMLFDNQSGDDLQPLGQVSVPSLADIFVGVLAKEAI
ncbi:ABC transporter ATP-binding protein [Thalassotalea castellviae]|uniref:ABC transporter ATP-binding protein n=1 Tax=Thalassotalea castellviae TaxID=3075612 RepID=A0ABU2ZXC9_9GAMM|nr:ABC transporter ATP-binding protein [Thalassotalea sp. W431]MDT0602589.1 ABC transporter ATP-binding protein [Thalassotalea sp. W431]